MLTEVFSSTQARIAALIIMLFSLTSCTNMAERPPIDTEENVDLARFMGDWFVIANIPTFLEKGAHNAVESYRMAEDGRIETTFTFRDGGFDGEKKVYTPTGFVQDSSSNAVWGMQFIWPFEADYRIAYVDDDYRLTVIARNKRDYAWIMAREPSISDQDYQQMVALLAEQGYDVSKLEKVPQRWE